MKKSLKITVHGKVQGVGYREFVKKCATELAIEGTAQNIETGAVLIYASGPSDTLENLIDSLYMGTPTSKIKEIFYESFSSDKDFHGVFRVIGELE